MTTRTDAAVTVTAVTTTADAASLVARTVTVTGPHGAAGGLDLLAAAGTDGLLWQDGDFGLAGRGTALRIDLPGGLADRDGVAAVRGILAAVRRDDEVAVAGTGPVALGALAFDPGASGSLLIPRVLLGRHGDRAWITTVMATGTDGPPGADGSSTVDAGAPVDDIAAEMLDAARTGRRPVVEAPDDFHLVSTMPQAEWRRLIAEAVARIRAGDMDKVVLARRIDVRANRPIVTSDVLARLLALYPACKVFRVDGFLGASPELLVRRRGDVVRSHPLAGTIARSGDVAADRALVAGLLASAKDRSEHRFVIDDLERALSPICTRLDVPAEPTILELRNVSHLATLLEGVLAPTEGTVPTALELVARVHPTPAVGGTPTDVALRYIGNHEGFDRGRYAGPVGWVDADGDGAWAIGIRSADVDGSRAAMYAGVGVVADSDPRAELVETQLKLQALLAALVRP